MHLHTRSLERLRHSHDFASPAQASAERRTRVVFWLTLITMGAEILAGWLTGSMALLADGWHMGSHAAALGISAFAYAFSRRHAADPRFTFGTGKVGPLAAYTSALLLAVIALLMAAESVERLSAPVAVHFDEAMLVAVLGLAVNVASALILGGAHEHTHEHPHEHGHESGDPVHGIRLARGPSGHHHHDHNLRSAYLHVLADALTSVLAIAALMGGKFLGWVWMDPAMGLVGAALIGRWSAGLLRDAGQVLLDAEDHARLAARVGEAIEANGADRISDLHLWRVGPGSFGCIVSIVTHDPRSADHYRELLLRRAPSLEHVTVEVNICSDEDCGP